MNVIERALELIELPEIMELARKELRRKLADRARAGSTHWACQESDERGIGHIVEVLQQPMRADESKRFRDELLELGIDCRKLVTTRGFRFDTLDDIKEVVQSKQGRPKKAAY